MKPTLRPGEIVWIDRNIFARGTRTRGVRYGISFCHDGRRIRKVVGSTITEARKVLSVTRSEIVRGRYDLTSTEPSPTLEAFSRRYLDHAQTAKRSWKTDEYLLKPVRAVLGARQIRDITAWHLEQYKAHRRAAVGPRTVNMELSLLRRMFHLAITWGVATKNPVTAVRMFREDERPMRILTLEEQGKLLGCCRDHLRDLVLFALHTGLRRGEILGLTWSSVDFTENVITVEGSKTGRLRHVPMNAITRTLLERRKEDGTKNVFTWQGKPFTRFDKTWKMAVAAAGIAPIRFHDLRHTFATRLVLAGVDLVTVGELLGHRSMQMTLRYSHPSPEHKRKAVDRLAEVTPICHFSKKPKSSKAP